MTVRCPPQAVLRLQKCGFISRRLRGENEAYPKLLRWGEGGRSLALLLSRSLALSLSRSLGLSVSRSLGSLGGSVDRWIGGSVTQVTRVNAFVRGLGTPPGSVQVAQCAILSGVGPSAGAKTGAWEHTGAVGVAL